jgi:hypothetical protein
MDPNSVCVQLPHIFLKKLTLFNQYSRNQLGQIFFQELALFSCTTPSGVTYEEVASCAHGVDSLSHVNRTNVIKKYQILKKSFAQVHFSSINLKKRK